MPMCKECGNVVGAIEIKNGVCKNYYLNSTSVNNDILIGSTIHYCPNCGFKLKGNEQFCPKCGNSINNMIQPSNTEKTKEEPFEKISDISPNYLFGIWIIFTIVMYAIAAGGIRDIMFNAGQAFGGLLLAIPITGIVLLYNGLGKSHIIDQDFIWPFFGLSLK